jgi:hypothetical protein
MSDLPDVIERLAKRVEALEHRVAALERPSATPDLPAAPASAEPLIAEPAIAPAAAAAPSLEAGMAFSVLGRAMMGIAGAYLLRAAAQANLLSSRAAAALAILYAIGWLAWAARTRAGAWFAATAYAGTSALILAPMLWELMFRFHLLSAVGAATVLGAYVSIASALAWKRNLAPVFWVANVAAVLIALSLSVGSRVTTPFIAVLLLMLALGEFAEACGREAGARALTSLAADLAIWAAIYIYISPPGARPDYPPLGMAALVAPGFALFAIFLASVVFDTIVKRQRIAAFEIVQTIIAFLLAAAGLICFGPPSAAMILGAICLVLTAACYAAAYLFFRNTPDRRNYRVFAIWSAILLLAGCLLSLPDAWKAPCLGVAAVVATALGARFNRFVLQAHGVFYLLATAAVSGLAAYIVHALAGILPGAPSWNIYFALVCAVLCYAVMPWQQNPSWRQHILQLLAALLAICGGIALLVRGLMALLALRVEPAPHHLAFFRTVAVCAAALALAYSGPRWRRIELTRIGYAAVVLVAIKLVFEDLRRGRLEYIAGSIFVFAVTLIAVPRLARRGRKPETAPTPAPDL